MEFNERKFKPPSNRELLYQQVQEQSDICDVTIQVGQWQKKFHWCVLVMSPFFESIRRNNFIEKQTGLVKLDIATSVTTETAILFMYGRKPKLTDENVVSVLELAEYLLISNLKSACVSFLKANVSVTEETCMAMLEVASLYDFEFSKCYDFIRGHLQDIFLREEAKRLTKESVVELFTDPLLSYVTAEEKFAFLVKWGSECNQNILAFHDAFEAIDFRNVSGEFYEEVVLKNPLVTEAICNNKSMLTRDCLQEHRVLVFLDVMNDDRLACFDLDNEKWCGIEASIPEGTDMRNRFNRYSIESHAQDSTAIYRIANAYDCCSICIHDLQSHVATVSKVSTPDDSEQRARFSAYCMDGETFVAVANDTKRTNRRSEQSHVYPEDLLRLGLLANRDPITQLVIAHRIQSQLDNNVHINTSTVFYGQIQVPETKLESLLTIPDAEVSSVCINVDKLVALLEKNKNTLYICDIINGLFDTIPLEIHLSSNFRYSRGQMKLAAKEDGFVCYNNKVALVIARLNGPTLRERYTVQKVDLEYSTEWNIVQYFYNNNSWFRILRKKWESEIEFTRISHDEVIGGNGKELVWKQLPWHKDLPRYSGHNEMFMMKLPKSMLRCHFDCPHCKQQRQQKSTVSRKTVDAEYTDYFYEDSDDESYGNYSFGYDDYYGDYYYYSSD